MRYFISLDSSSYVIGMFIDFDGSQSAGFLSVGYVEINNSQYSSIGPNSLYKGGAIVAGPERSYPLTKDWADLIKAAKVYDVSNKTMTLQTQLNLGIISDVDKEYLTDWMKYAQALQLIDTSLAPNIIWPTEPAK